MLLDLLSQYLGDVAAEIRELEDAKVDGFVKSLNSVTPAKAGVQKLLK